MTYYRRLGSFFDAIHQVEEHLWTKGIPLRRDSARFDRYLHDMIYGQ